MGKIPKGKGVGRIEKLNKQISADAHEYMIKELLAEEVYLKRMYFLTKEVPDPNEIGPDCEVKYVEEPVMFNGRPATGTLKQLVNMFSTGLKGLNLHRLK